MGFFRVVQLLECLPTRHQTFAGFDSQHCIKSHILANVISLELNGWK